MSCKKDDCCVFVTVPNRTLSYATIELNTIFDEEDLFIPTGGTILFNTIVNKTNNITLDPNTGIITFDGSFVNKTLKVDIAIPVLTSGGIFLVGTDEQFLPFESTTIGPGLITAAWIIPFNDFGDSSGGTLEVRVFGEGGGITIPVLDPFAAAPYITIHTI